MIGIRGFIVLAFAVVGFIATYFASDTLRTNALKNWQHEARGTAESLSGTLLGCLEESYAHLSGLAALTENSSNVE